MPFHTVCTTPAIINGLPFLCSNRDPEKFNEAYLVIGFIIMQSLCTFNREMRYTDKISLQIIIYAFYGFKVKSNFENNECFERDDYANIFSNILDILKLLR